MECAAGGPSQATSGIWTRCSSSGQTHYLWRAVDQHGTVLDILVTSRRDVKAATRFFRKLQELALRTPGAGHQQAGQLWGGYSPAYARCGASPVEVSEQPGRELSPADPGAGTGDEEVQLTG
jgi:hypothetical protein